MTTTLVLPDHLRDLPLVASVSGGKDSTAMALALREAGLPFRMVFADTGWEHEDTYAHLDMLRERLGPIEVVRALPKVDRVASDVTIGLDRSRPMVDRIVNRAGFPARMQRWCTRELKIEPLRAYHDTLGDDTVSVIGVRADESPSRAKMIAVEDDCEWGGWIWRPMLGWTIADVLAIHHRHGIAVNPLYQRGHDRVGCYPCIFARKNEIKLVAEHSPERIAEIRDLEERMTALRAERNAAVPETVCEACKGRGRIYETHTEGCDTLLEGDEDACTCGYGGTGCEVACLACNSTGRVRVPRYNHGHAAFFQTRMTGEYDMGIDEVVAWSRTARGGKQLPLLLEPPSGGCFRWGLCEPPAREVASVDGAAREEEADGLHAREAGQPDDRDVPRS